MSRQFPKNAGRIGTMRLNQPQIHTILGLVEEVYGKHAAVHLFGSRLDDSATGGDIDLLLELPTKRSLREEIQLSAKLEHELGVPVDLITTFPQQPSRAIVEIARMTGTRL